MSRPTSSAAWRTSECVVVCARNSVPAAAAFCAPPPPPAAARRAASPLNTQPHKPHTQHKHAHASGSDLRVAALQELKELIDRAYRSHASKVQHAAPFFWGG